MTHLQPFQEKACCGEEQSNPSNGQIALAVRVCETFLGIQTALCEESEGDDLATDQEYDLTAAIDWDDSILSDFEWQSLNPANKSVVLEGSAGPPELLLTYS